MSSSIAMAPTGAFPRRGAVPALASLALHLLAAFLFAGVALRMPREDHDRILVTVAKAAAPPPPLMLDEALGPQTAAPDWWEREEPDAVPKPRPIVKPKRPIHAKDRPKPKAPELQAVAAPEPSAAVGNSAAANPPSGGASGGVAGGSPGGLVGGVVGGRGDSSLRIDQVATPPRIVDRVMPKYPSQARARRLEGVVVLEAVVDRQGRVETTGLHMVHSQEPFDVAALEAFRRWRFEPARDNSGEPVRVLVRQAIRFELR